MNIKLELIREYVASKVVHQIEDFEIDVNRIANTKAIRMLGEIQAILQNDKMNDAEMISARDEIFSDNKMTGGWWQP